MQGRILVMRRRGVTEGQAPGWSAASPRAKQLQAAACGGTDAALPVELPHTTKLRRHPNAGESLQNLSVAEMQSAIRRPPGLEQTQISEGRHNPANPCRPCTVLQVRMDHEQTCCSVKHRAAVVRHQALFSFELCR